MADRNEAEISDQLAREEEWVERMERSLGRSRQLKTQLLGILDSFQLRLNSLEASVLPLYKQTHALQLKQQNIGKTLKAINTRMEYCAIANEMDSLIRDTQPSEDLEAYLKHMEKLQKATRFFAADKHFENQLDNVKSSFEFGCSCLEREFKETVRKASTPLKPATLIQAIGDNYEVVGSRLKSLDLMADSWSCRLKRIGGWLLHHSSSSDFLQFFAEIRVGAMDRTLQALEDSRKSASGGRVNAASPKVDRKISTTSKAAGTFRKSSRVPFISDQSVRRGPTLGVDNPDSPLDKEAETFLYLLAGFRALLEAESSLLKSIVESGEHETHLFRILLIRPLGLVLARGEALCGSARRCLSRGDHGSILCLFPVAQYLHAHSDSLQLLAQNAGPEVHGKLREAMQTIDSLCVRGLEDFVEFVKNDQDKFVPRDATVHQITSNTLVFLEQLMEVRDCLALILAADDVAGKVAVPKLFARVLSALGLNLRNKAAGYSDSSQKALFMLNNYNHILKSLSKSGVLKVVCEQNREVESYYQAQVEEFKKQYLQCWGRLLNVLGDFPQRPVGGTPVSDKQKDQLKAAFSTFNRELEGVSGSQRQLSVPDPELAATLKKDTKELLLPKYQPFFQKYAGTGFTKNPDKYVRFTPDAVANTLDRLFDHG